MKLKSKLFASAVAFTMVLSLVAVPASAQTTAELTAQINSLLAMIAQLQAQIAGMGGSAAMGTAVQYNTDLTVGSTGADVTSLQQFLVGKGYLQMPVGVSYGYFGPLTRAATAAYQASVGITPAVGYFGPITRANVNALSVSTGGTTGGTTTGGSTGITTPGAEGTLTVTTNNAGLVSTAYEGDDMAPVIGVNVEAKSSDIAIQRVKLNLGTNSKIYTKGYSKMYVTDSDGNILASSDLNSSTVVKESSTYYITIAGFSYVVPKDSKKQLIMKADVMGAIDSADRTTLNALAGIIVPANGVRGVDGAGIDQYGPTAALTARNVTFSADLVESASLAVSLNTSTPKKNDVVCASGASENECDKLTVLTFDLKAEKDSVKMTDINIGMVRSGSGGATTPVVYLYDGSTELDSASIVNNAMATFSNIDYVVPKDTTKTLTVKVDVNSAATTITNYAPTASSTGITAENSVGDSVTPSGTATGYSVGVLSVGPQFTLVSKSIATAGTPQANDPVAGNSTSTITATFNIKIKAIGGAIEFGTSQSTTSPIVSSSTGFGIYRDGTAVTTLTSAATSTSITAPSNCSTSGFTNSCSLPEGNEGTFAVSYQLQGRAATGTQFTAGLYSFDIARLNWIDPVSGKSSNSTFMSGETDWRTADVSFP